MPDLAQLGSSLDSYVNARGELELLVHNNLGAALQAQQKYEAAEAQYTEALRLRPEYDKVHYNFGNALYPQGKYEEAVAQYTEALRLNPRYAEAYNNMGNVLRFQGKNDAAVANYTESLRVDPGYADAHKNLGDVLFLQEKYRDAEVHLTEALRLNPGYADVHGSLGAILARRHAYAEAKTHLADAIRLRPDDSNAYNESAMIMASCPDAKFRDGKKAVEFATRACELTGWKNPEVLDTLASAQAEVGDYGAAVAWQEQAIKLLTDDRQRSDYRSRLALYKAKKPYRDVPSATVPDGTAGH